MQLTIRPGLNICLISLCLLLFIAAPLYAHKKLIVGVYDNSPLVYLNNQGKYSGLSVEVLEHIAAQENWKLEYQHGTWPECLRKLKNGETDIQILIGYTRERDLVYDYTQESLFVAWGQVYTNPAIKAQSILDLKDRTVAIYKDSLLSKAFKELLQKFDIKCTLIEVDDYAAIAGKIISKQADAGVFNRTFALRYSDKSDLIKTPIVFSPTPLFYAVPEGKHRDVLIAIDSNLSQLKKDKTSLYYQSLMKSFGSTDARLIPDWVKWTLTGVVALLIAIGFISLFLKNQVKLRTRELQAKNRLLEKEIEVRTLTEEKLLRWEHIFKDSQWGIALGEVDGKTFNLMNPAYAKMHGYSTEELLNKEIPSMFIPSFREKLPDVIEKCHEMGHYTFEAEHLRKDGTTFPAYHDVTTVRNEEGQVAYKIVNVVDITERKKAENDKAKLESELRQAHKMEAIGTLAGGIAHDFNNILAAILGYAEMVRDQVARSNPAYEDIQEILKAGKRAKELVGHILAFSRKSEQKRIPVSMHLITTEAIKLLRASLPSTIAIEKYVERDCNTVLSDPTEGHQVVMNLCTNAAQAMSDKGGILKISLSKANLAKEDLQQDRTVRPGKYIQLTVSDSGHGISPEHLDRIFDPYFTTKEIGEGSGMGLAVVHGIVKSNNGMIKVRNRNNGGAKFTVYFPMEKQVTTSERENADSIPGGSEHILVVDDEISVVKMTKRRLEQLGYQVTAEDSSVRALELFTKNPDEFDCVISDQTMPELTGKQLAEKIREISPAIPIIICSGYNSIQSLKPTGSAGINKIIMKPVDRQELAVIIRQILDETRNNIT